MICLDTSVIVDFLRNNSDAIEALNEINGEQLATTTINIYEIVLGILRKKTNYNKEFASLMKLAGNLSILELNYDSSFKAAEIGSDLIKRGMEIQSNDCLIAGVMLSNDCNRIITRDKEHFQRIKGIRVEGY